MDGVVKAVLSLSWHSCALITLALLAAYLWYRVAYLPYSVFKKLGIAGPPPKAFLGNASDISDGKRVLSVMQSWTKQYGKVCGFYFGAIPTYLISDLDMLKQIMVKEFSNFTDRVPAYEADGVRKGTFGLLIRIGEDWQQTRRIVSGTFSTRKLKLMVPLVEESCTALFEKIQKVAESAKSDDIWRIYGQFTMETFLAASFGYKVDIMRKKTEGGDELIAAAERIFNSPPTGQPGGLLFVLHSHFKWLTPVMRWLGSLFSIRSDFRILNSAALGFVQDRRKNPRTKVKDLLQLTIDASADDDDQLADPDIHGGGSQPSSSSSSSSHSKKTLTDDDIVGLATGFMLAGYETTSNGLGYTSYLLALNPDKQEKLCADIDAYYEENEETSLYDAAHSIEYLDWVIQSFSLRKFKFERSPDTEVPLKTRLSVAHGPVNGIHLKVVARD